MTARLLTTLPSPRRALGPLAVSLLLAACLDPTATDSPTGGGGAVTAGSGGGTGGGGVGGGVGAGTGGGTFAPDAGPGGLPDAGAADAGNGNDAGTEAPALCQIATGRYHTVLLKDDGSVWNWGRDIGDTPVQVTALGTDNLQVEGGVGESCARKVDGSIWCWANGMGPQKVWSGPTRTFAKGFTHTCAIKPDDTLWCWGGNEHGQLGHGQQTLSSSGLPAAQVTELGNQTAQVTAGDQFTCALKKDGTAWCWGQNEDGWLGIGRTSPYEERPAQVTVLGADVASISGENEGACAIKTDGSVWCWWGSPDSRDQGSNAGAVAVNAAQAPPSPPVQVPMLGSAKSISIGRRVATALTADGSVWTWGPVYALGRSTPAGPTPGQVTDLGTRVKAVTSRYRHACARLADGTLWCWGSTSHGSIGNGQPGDSLLPAQVLTTCH